MYIENFKFPTTFAFPLGSNLKIPAKHLGAVSYISSVSYTHLRAHETAR